MATTTDLIQQLYVAYYNRPADVRGLAFWVDAYDNKGVSLDTISKAFNNAPEYTSLFAGKSLEGTVGVVYQNLFGHLPDSTGLKFWTNALANNQVTVADLVRNVIAGAVNADGTPNADGLIFANKVAAAEAFTTEIATPGNEAEQIAYADGGNALTVAKTFISSVTDTTSLTNATANIHATAQSIIPAPASTTLALTGGVDNLTGSSAVVNFTATGATLTALDSINGGSGKATLTVVDTTNASANGLPAGVSLKNIQAMVVNAAGNVGTNASAGSAAVPAAKQVDTVTFGGAFTVADTYTVQYNGVTVTTAAIGTADAAHAAALVAAAVNGIAGTTVATVVGGQVVMTSPTAGVALPSYTFTNTVSTVAATSVNSVANATGSAAQAAAQNAVYDVSGVTGLTNFTVSSIGGDNINAGATTNVTLTDVASNSTETVAGGNNVTVTNSGTAGAIVVDGAAGTTTVNQNTAGNVTVGGTTAPSGAIVVNDTAQGAGVIAVDGGTNVSVTTASTGTTGTITIGNTTKPTGTVTVAESLSGSAGSSFSAGTVTVKGGTTVTVNNTATEAVRATTGGNGTITEANVVVNGGSSTTAVTVNQTATVAAVGTVVAVAGATETVSEKFVALTTGQTLIVGGLTFTAGAAGTTAAQTAAAFANLATGATQGNSVLGTYTGTFTGWNTGAATGTNSDTVVFTSSTANSVQAAPVFTGTGTAPTATVTVTGAAATSATAGVGGVTAGTFTVVDSKYVAAGTNTINSVTANGYATGSAISSDALTKLSLANAKDAAVVVNNRTATSLDLTVSGLSATTAGVASTLNLDNAAVKYTNLAVHTGSTANSTVNVTAAGVQGLTIDGSKAINLTGSTFTALKTVTVSGAAGVTAATAFTGASVTDVNASATSGAVSATVNATTTTYEGGSGVDTITLANSTVSKAISLGAGNDTIVLAGGTTSLGAVIDGGAGTDTLSMAAGDAVTASLNSAFSTKAINFEVLKLTGGAGAQLVHVDTLGSYNSVSTGAEANAGVLTLDGFTSGGTLTLTSSAAGTGAYVVSSSAFTTPTNDVFNLALSAAGAVAGGTVTANKIETINIAANDSSTLASGAPVAPGTNTDSLTLTADSVTKLVVTGNANLQLTSTNATVTSVDASAMTGGLTYTAAGTVAETIKGGAGSNVLAAATGATTADVLIGGAGNDTLTSNKGMDTLTGGAGHNTFVIGAASSNVNSYATITDAKVGDMITFSTTGTLSFAQSKITLGATAVFQDFANAAVSTASVAVGTISWFQFGGDTYIVQKEGLAAETSFTNGTDMIVKLTGAVDLSHTSLNTGIATLLIG